MSDQTLLEAVEAFLVETAMADSAFGRGAVNDWKFVRGLREGRRVWPETEDKIRAFMAERLSSAEPEHASTGQTAEESIEAAEVRS